MLHRLLRLLLPSSFRRRHGAAMEATFRERLQRAGSPLGRVALWLGEGRDVVSTALRLRWSRARRGGVDDLRAAVRSLRRAPGTTVTAVVTLGLGIGAAIALFSALDRVMLRPVDLPQPDRLVSVWRRMGPSFRTSPDLEARESLREADGLFDALVAFSQQPMILSGRGEPESVAAVWVDPGFVDIAGVTPLRGRLLQPDDEGRHLVVLSEGLWHRLGAGDVVGSTLRLDGEPWTVVGVAPRTLRFPSPSAQPTDVWVPMARNGSLGISLILGRLAPGTTLSVARERLAGINQARSEAGAQGELEIVPAGELETRSLRGPMTILMAAVALLLAMACASVAGLLLARSEARSSEAAVRAALGASRCRLARQQLMESVVLASLAAALGLGLARLALAVLPRVRPDALTLLDGLTLDGRVLAFAIGATATSLLVFGLVPSLRVGRGRVGELLGGGRHSASAGVARARRVLVTVEVALSFVLLVAAVKVTTSLLDAQSRDVGFQDRGLVAVQYRLPDWRFSNEDELAAANRAIQARVEALGGVESAVIASGVPPAVGIYFGHPQAEGGPEPDPSAPREVLFGASVGPGYVETLRLPVLRGRGFQEEDRDAGEQLWLMGESTARRYFPPDGDAVGRDFRMDPDAPWGTVVGVVSDVLAWGGLNAPDYGQIYEVGQAASGRTLLVRGSGDLDALVPEVRAAIRSVDPELPVVKVDRVEDLFSAALARERLTALLLTCFAAAAALLAVVGLYGVVTQVARVRRREFGIRLSLGARPATIYRWIMSGTARTVVVGMVAGVVLAWLGIRSLASQVPGLDAGDPRAYALAAVLLGLAAVSATSLPARAAARSDPAQVLRDE